MIQLPPGFSVSVLYSELFGVATPFVSLAFLIGCGFLFAKMLARF